jgi:hypothetical protein
MKLQNLVLIGLLCFVPAATLSAQNSLPNPHDDNCWSSLGALRACQLQTYNQAQDYAQRCTSYPEYQCVDYYQPQRKVTARTNSNAGSSTPGASANPGGAPNADLQSSSAN